MMELFQVNVFFGQNCNAFQFSVFLVIYQKRHTILIREVKHPHYEVHQKVFQGLTWSTCTLMYKCHWSNSESTQIWVSN